MRDFTAGRDIKVGRDVYIQEETSQPYKLLSQCTSEELYPEREHRKILLRKEHKRKLITGVCLALGAEIVVCGVGLWYYLSPSPMLPNIHTLIFSIGTVLVPGGV